MKLTKNLILSAVAAFGLLSTTSTHAAQVDYGITLGKVINNGLTSVGGSWQLGTFSGYTDVTGAAFFTGKDYATLQSSWLPFAGSEAFTDSLGQFYQSVDLGTTSANIRLFAWGYSTPTASASANWTVVSGTIGGLTIYDGVWLAPSPSAIDVNIIELGVTSNVLYANSNPGNALVANSNAPSEGSADIVLVPEPSTYALLSLAGLALGGYAARRRLRA
jgi:hypothetical protein